MELIPIVIALYGTELNPSKSPEASSLVIGSKLISLVPEFSWDPGSLKPMCAVLPIPSNCRSIPPNESIFFS